jgi:hypothetical protein
LVLEPPVPGYGFLSHRTTRLMEMMILALYLPLAISFSTDGARQVPKPLPPLRVVNVCEVVTKPDVELALGRHLVGAGWTTRSSRERCDYQAEGGQVTIRLEHSATTLDPKTEFAALKKAFRGSHARQLAGMGAPAILLDLPEAGTQVFVIEGDHRYLLVSILGFGDAAKVSKAAELLARQAFQRAAR